MRGCLRLLLRAPEVLLEISLRPAADERAQALVLFAAGWATG